ncbi:hypothetical protein FRZ03_09755 [Streptomyces misionensis]|uniref:Uncharacterized protein n=1 Tax=Streptomyces misionensis TaxID=67331 RepID=A0A5C6JY67_9ACTN|nr:hypothetical protein [Streptomyces misionensis]TWV53559.1 hypothetical protein FRZ03_09755 [Streptomyces misionensis]
MGTILRHPETDPSAHHVVILAVEGLLAGAIQDEHAAHLALHAIVERVRAELQAAGPVCGGPTTRMGPARWPRPRGWTRTRCAS